jgi:tagaturonate reductase
MVPLGGKEISMILNKLNLNGITHSKELIIPDAKIFDLPEKVLQFGTGVLLRGLPDYFINKANQQGVFNGRVVVVKSTDKGDAGAFDVQDGLYTIAVRGVVGQTKVEENIISSAVSRVISAQNNWSAVLEIAASSDLQIIISNTTEAGIELAEDDIKSDPPESFPGKLLAVLYHRYQKFMGDESKGLIILPTELISDNGNKLREIVSKLAEQNGLDRGFMDWLRKSNTFCNTLVDRIVPGRPDEITLDILRKDLGYQDDLLIMTEVYALWAIEGEEQLKEVLSFEQLDPGIVIAPDITLYKELKLRLLNGTHSLSCAIAYLGGFETVNEAMQDRQFSEFVTALAEDELATAIPYPVAHEEALQFSRNVLDRFRNPHIRHYWLSISANYTLKLKMRVIPLLLRYFKNFNRVPENIAFGFAAYLKFMQSEKNDQAFLGRSNGGNYQIEDERAAYYSELWAKNSASKVVEQALSNIKLWDTNLALLPGFADSVKRHLGTIEASGIITAMNSIDKKRESAL